MPVELLLVDTRDGQSVLGRPIDDISLPLTLSHAAPQRPPLKSSKPASDRPLRWTLVVEDSEHGDMRLEDLQPLIEHRQRRGPTQGNVRVVRIPRLSSEPQDIDSWRERVAIGDAGAAPEYVLLVGELTAIPLEVQYVLAEVSYVGRLCFSTHTGHPDRASYRAYADKIVASESRPLADGSRSLFYCSRGDPVSEQAYGSVVRRSWKASTNRAFAHRFTRWKKLARFIDETKQPAILFSMCHGAYEPDPDLQRARQGGLVLQEAVGDQYEYLFAEHFVGQQRFLPNGFWFMMTCYSAATPATSLYARWLEQLTSVVSRAQIQQAISSLAVERPFIARIPQVVLAHPEGPLGVLGHADMTWSMGYNDHRLDRETGDVETVVGAAYAAYASVVERIAAGDPFGASARALLERDGSRGDQAEESQTGDQAEESQTGDQAAIWRALQYMRYLDRRCYVLLGDPAARLPITARQ